MGMKTHHLLSTLLCLCCTIHASSQQQQFTATQYGIVPDGKTLNTSYIQQAINKLSQQSKGGTLVFTPGVYLTGKIELKNNVTLHLQKGATLLGSTHPAHYEEDVTINGKRGDEDVNQGLIYANGAHNIAITGQGTIDGQGLELALCIDSLHHTGERIDPNYNYKRMRPTTRPKLFCLRNCQGISIKGITARNSAGWGISLHQSSDIEIDSITVFNRAYWNNDGIDLGDCHNATITHCNINSADDGICLKSDEPADCCSNIYIAHCRIASSASAIKFGTASYGGFRNVTIKDIEVYDTFRSAIALETVDGGILQDILVDGVKAENTGNPLFIRLGARAGERQGICKNITIRNMEVEVPFTRPDQNYNVRGPEVNYFHNPWPSSITGIPGQYVENVTLENLHFIYPGRATKAMGYVGLYRANQVKEAEKEYPEFSMFGELPSWAFYIRHVKGINLKNVKVQLKDADFRPAFVLEDVLDAEGFPEDTHYVDASHIPH